MYYQALIRVSKLSSSKFTRSDFTRLIKLATKCGLCEETEKLARRLEAQSRILLELKNQNVETFVHLQLSIALRRVISTRALHKGKHFFTY